MTNTPNWLNAISGVRFLQVAGTIYLSLLFFTALGFLVDSFVTEVSIPLIGELFVGVILAVLIQAGIDAARDSSGDEEDE